MSDESISRLSREARRSGVLAALVWDDVDFKLCYVESQFAWFTTLPVVGPGSQWGDDWNDVPYEHNAGAPSKPPEGHRLLVVAWSGDLDEPKSGYGNSPWSVEQINSGAVAWLRSSRFGSGPLVAISAGCSLGEFVEKVQMAGGEVYLPMRVPT